MSKLLEDNSLLIVESPAKMKIISSYLKQLGCVGCDVLASYGHINNLLGKKHAIDVENDFAMVWEDTKQSTKAVPPILKAAKKASQLVIATDPDREGEAIGWHVYRKLKENGIDLPVKRVLFYSITKKEIKRSLEEASVMRGDLIDAYLARLSLDFLVGFYISPLLWRKLPGCLSAGRVQSAALKNIVELEYKRKQFKSQTYYVIEAALEKDKQEFFGKVCQFEDEVFERSCIYKDKKYVDGVAAYLENSKLTIDSVEKKKASKGSPAPLITSTLQQEASHKLRMSPSQSMKVAQQLYEGVKINAKETVGFITYMRTDSVNMSGDALKECRAWIQENLGDKYLHSSVKKYKGKVRNAQEAHECIRPTNFSMTPQKARDYIDGQMLDLYTLIWNRSIASQMSDLIQENTNVMITDENKKIFLKTTGSVILFEGYMYLLKDALKDKIIPSMSEDDSIDMKSYEVNEKETQPPSRYTSASLIARLESLGIGRPSTYARIIDIIQEREYIEKIDSFLVPTQKSWFLIGFLDLYFKQYLEYGFTAALEEKLDDVANGGVKWKNLISNFWKDFQGYVEKAGDIKYEDMRPLIEEMWKDFFFPEGKDKCGKCGAKAAVRFWKGQVFISCSNHPECDWKRYVEATEEPVVFGNDPETGQQIRLIQGPYGPYFQWDSLDDHKVKKVSLPKILQNKDLSLEEVMKLKNIPFVIGNHPDTNEPISIGVGKFGPYLKYQDKFTSVKTNPLELDLQACLDILAKPRPVRKKIVRKTKK